MALGIATGILPLLGRPAMASPVVWPLQMNGWPALRQALARRKAVVHLWGLTCAPCIEELAQWARFVQRFPSEQIVLIQVEPADIRRVGSALMRANVRGGEQYSVEGLADARWRFSVDPKWGGELPRTLLLDAGKTIRSFSGPADLDEIGAWLSSR